MPITHRNVRVFHPTERWNFSRVEIGYSLTLWFSYETCVGYFTPDQGYVLSENVWGPTTGRHINSIIREAGLVNVKRLPRDEFNLNLGKTLTDGITP